MEHPPSKDRRCAVVNPCPPGLTNGPVLALLLSLLFPAALGAQSDTCDGATEILPGRFTGSTEGMASDGEAPCGKSLDKLRSPDAWFRITPEESCELVVDSCNSGFDTVLSIHSGCPGSPDNALTCNDDLESDGCFVQSRVSVEAVAGETYLIRLGGFGEAAGDYAIDVSCEPIVAGRPGDTCETAAPVDFGVVTGDTSTLTSAGSANCGNSATAPDAWFRYTATKRCFLVASTCGSAFDTVLSVHDGCPGTRRNQLTCNDDACNLQSRVGLVAEEGATYWIRVSGFGGDRGAFRLELSCHDIPEGEGGDLQVANMEDISQVGREGSVVAISAQSVLCNTGSLPIDWRGIPENEHPFLAFNAYRLLGDRFEQIGRSWVKHGFAVSQSDLCGSECIPSNSFSLGLDCADIYDTVVNADRHNTGPRSEVNPRTGEFAFRGSWIERNQGRNFDDIELRLQVHDDDLDPEQNPESRYFLELYAFSHDDTDRTNSLGSKRFAVRGRPGSTWNLSPAGGVRTGPAADSWLGATRTTVPEDPTDSGRCYVYVKTSENGDGTWHYEYAVFNLDMDHAVWSFAVPVAPWTSVRDLGFRLAPSHDEGLSNAPWEAERTDSEILWRAAGSPLNPRPTPLVWGTLFNFRFDADAPPAESTVTLGTARPDPPREHTGPAAGPSMEPRFRRGDADGDGQVVITDVVFLLEFLFAGGDAPPCRDAADIDDSGGLEITDGILGFAWLFQGGGEPAPPGPLSCGEDPTEDALEGCVYDPSDC